MESPADNLVTLTKPQPMRPAQDTRLLIAISRLLLKHERIVLNHQTFQESAQHEREE